MYLGCLYIIWSIGVADVGVILVGDSISWVRPSSVTAKSPEECGFSKSILKSPNKMNVGMRLYSTEIVYHLYKVIEPLITN